MESLSRRLDVVQESLLNLYETDSTELKSQVEHWSLARRENALLHCARRAGVLRVGYQPVPPLAASQERAKQAIEMQLTLESLLHTEYAWEAWTLADTSWERWTAEPSRCRKKGADQVEVRYDGDKQNCMWYTAWRSVYYIDADDVWHKTRSVVDHCGVYYRDRGGKRYYVRFERDAQRFSRSGQWDVLFNGETISSLEPVTSTTPPGHVPRAHQLPGGRETPDRDRSPTPVGPKRLRPAAAPAPLSGPQEPDVGSTSSGSASPEPCEGRPGGGPGAGALSPPGPEGLPRARRTLELAPGSGGSGGGVRGGGGRGGGGGGGGAGGGGAKRQRRVREHRPGAGGAAGRLGPPVLPAPLSPGLPAPDPSRSPSPVALGTPLAPPEAAPTAAPDAGGPVGAPASPHAPAPGASPPHAARAAEGARRGVYPAAQGLLPALHRRPERPRHLLREAGAGSPLLAVLKGPCNVLKCFRYRAKNRHRTLFHHISTTWYWAGEEGAERLGDARILVKFRDPGQRDSFFTTVKLPGGVSVCASMADL
ncbi:E2 [Ailuropoda melanoleuca papillomavirus 4]|uniref:Regulatory protein E2 n=1 Tax=Ailuropoda melanoleuca papillomavirus 4 TaxID=2016453 RepID=A0A220IGE7_9PAPI|nr:E2 [Ailuropoda melanoleuca papillomavirus 4]